MFGGTVCMPDCTIVGAIEAGVAEIEGVGDVGVVAIVAIVWLGRAVRGVFVVCTTVFVAMRVEVMTTVEVGRSVETGVCVAVGVVGTAVGELVSVGKSVTVGAMVAGNDVAATAVTSMGKTVSAGVASVTRVGELTVDTIPKAAKTTTHKIVMSVTS